MRFIRLLLATLIPALIVVAVVPAQAASAAPATRTILIVAGQSNALGAQSFAIDPVTGANYMKGAAYVNGADTNDSITWRETNTSPYQEVTPVPLDTRQVIGGKQIFGPEIGLARQAWADTGQPIAIAKYTFSSTSLAVNWNPATAGDAYATMVALVKKLIATDAAAGTVDTIAGFYWYQGETDAGVTAEADAYQANLANFISHVRSALNIPTAPFVIAKEDRAQHIAWCTAAGTCDGPTQTAGDEAVRSADDWAAANLPDVTEVDTLGLPRFGPVGGYMHLTDTSVLTLGAELATAGGQ